jgi:hypothetical protein
MNRIGPIMRRFTLLSGICALLLLQLSGCWAGGVGGSLRSVSLGDNTVIFPTDFKIACYLHDPSTGTTSFMLSDVSPEKMIEGDIKDGQFMHVELLWVPLAGQTPMDSSATNASIRYIVISKGEMGIYGGAGFAYPYRDPGASSIRVALEDASIQLLQSTAGFNDLLSPAQMTGTFTARLDDKTTRQMNYAASQIVTNALGRTQFVWRAIDPAPGGDAGTTAAPGTPPRWISVDS